MANTQSSSPERDAIDLLMNDHKRVQTLFIEMEKADRSDTEALLELVETACMELQIHAILEEEIFYPAVRAQVEDDDLDNLDLLNRAQVEHDAVDELIAKLQELEPDDDLYAAHYSVLAEYVKHHVREEEKEFFPQVRKMAALDLAQLADDMRLRREELFAEIEAGETDDETESSAEGDDTSLPESDAEDDSEDAQEQVDISRTRH